MATRTILVAALLLVVPAALGQTPAPFQGITVTNYQCYDCVKDAAGNPQKVRAIFIESPSVVENPKAAERARELGLASSNCNDPALALPECFVAENWNSGWVGSLSKIIFDNLGVEVIAMTQANFTLNSSAVYSGGSSYTRCVWEIRVDGADICVGDFWETNERRRIAPFTSSFDLDTMRLLSMPGGGEGFKVKNFLNIFIPLEDTVWAVTVAMFFVTSFLMWFVEQGTGGEDFDYEDSLSSQTYRQLQGCCKSLYLTLLGMVSAAPCHAPVTWPGRLITLGYAFMLYITVASYTANLASTMITPSVVNGKIKSLADLGAKGTNLCLLEAMAPLIDENIVPADQIVGFGWYGPMLEYMYSGKCDGAVIGKTEYQTHVLGQAVAFPVCTDPRDPLNQADCQDPTMEPEIIDLSCNDGCENAPDMDRADCPESCPHYRKYCDILEVVDGNFELAIGIGMPVSNALQDYVSAWIVPLKLDRTVARLRTQFVDEAAPDVCNQGSGESVPLEVEDMAGIFFFSAVIMCIGLVFYVFEVFLCRPKVTVDALSAKIDVMMKRLEQLEQQDTPIVDLSNGNGTANGKDPAKKKPTAAENGPNGTEEKDDKPAWSLFG